MTRAFQQANHVFHGPKLPYTHEQLMEMGWPDDFDFETDPVCQLKFKPFIEDKLDELEAYHKKRNPRSKYVFHEHALRVAQDVKDTCLFMGLGPRVAENMYWATLPHDIGKLELDPKIWDSEDKPPAIVHNQKRRHAQFGRRVWENAFPHNRHPFVKLASDIIYLHHEPVSGKGHLDHRPAVLPVPVRLVAILEDLDGRLIARPHHMKEKRDVTLPTALKRMWDKDQGRFDPHLFHQVAQMKLHQYYKEQEQEALSTIYGISPEGFDPGI